MIVQIVMCCNEVKFKRNLRWKAESARVAFCTDVLHADYPKDVLEFNIL